MKAVATPLLLSRVGVATSGRRGCSQELVGGAEDGGWKYSESLASTLSQNQRHSLLARSVYLPQKLFIQIEN